MFHMDANKEKSTLKKSNLEREPINFKINIDNSIPNQSRPGQPRTMKIDYQILSGQSAFEYIHAHPEVVVRCTNPSLSEELMTPYGKGDQPRKYFWLDFYSDRGTNEDTGHFSISHQTSYKHKTVFRFSARISKHFQRYAKGIIRIALDDPNLKWDSTMRVAQIKSRFLASGSDGVTDYILGSQINLNTNVPATTRYKTITYEQELSNVKGSDLPPRRVPTKSSLYGEPGKRPRPSYINEVKEKELDLIIEEYNKYEPLNLSDLSSLDSLDVKEFFGDEVEVVNPVRPARKRLRDIDLTKSIENNIERNDDTASQSSTKKLSRGQQLGQMTQEWGKIAQEKMSELFASDPSQPTRRYKVFIEEIIVKEVVVAVANVAASDDK